MYVNEARVAFTLPFHELSRWDWPLTWLTDHVLQCLHCCLGHLTVKLSPKWPIMCRMGR